jgi:hypothetical protein
MLLMLAPTLCAETTPAGETDDAPKPLSVAPLDHVEYPDDRPDWVESSLDIDGDSVHIVVVSGPCDTPEESLEQLKLMLRAAVSTYVSRITGSGGEFDFYPISDEQIDHELVVRRYEGTVVHEGTTKYEHAVELGFTDEKRQEIITSWNNVTVGDRLRALSGLVVGGLVMLMCSSALLGMFSRRAERRDRLQVPA